MIRLIAPLAGLALLAVTAAASAQTYAPSWGQPVYLDGWGRPVGGTPLSEVQARSYAGTGRWADGHSDRPHVYVPRWASGLGYGHGPGRYRAPRPDQGYRDEWGYNDDRARPGRQGYVDGRRPRHDDGPDVYFYDR
ncbi:hypothetical protein [Brevundimonas sp.]|uniref:hypothetical protein n=1 Tax=Brevundimonas sp. TaxID=1871086 RepID=UPI003F7119A1